MKNKYMNFTKAELAEFLLEVETSKNHSIYTRSLFELFAYKKLLKIGEEMDLNIKEISKLQPIDTNDLLIKFHKLTIENEKLNKEYDKWDKLAFPKN